MLRLPCSQLALIAVIGCLLAPAAVHAESSGTRTAAAVSCARGGAVVTLANTGAAPVRFTVLHGHAVALSTVLSATVTPVTRIVPVPVDATETMTVRFGSSYVSTRIDGACTSSRAQVQAQQTDALTAGPIGAPASRRDVPVEDARGSTPLVAGLAAMLAALAVASIGVLVRRPPSRALPPLEPAARLSA